MRSIPPSIRGRDDAAQVWAAFQEYVPGHPGGSHLRAFIAGWEVAQSSHTWIVSVEETDDQTYTYGPLAKDEADQLAEAQVAGRNVRRVAVTQLESPPT